MLAYPAAAAFATVVSLPSVLAKTRPAAIATPRALASVLAFLEGLARLRHGCRYRLQEAPQLLTPYFL